MKLIVLTSVSCVLGLGALSGEAVANCTDNRLNQTQISQALSGRTVCASVGDDRWQEYHSAGAAGGNLIDYKKGANDPVDPTKKVGTWSVSGAGDNALVRHTYDAFGPAVSYDYAVYKNCQQSVQPQDCGSFSFCVGANEILATVLNGQVACPSP